MNTINEPSGSAIAIRKEPTGCVAGRRVIANRCSLGVFVSGLVLIAPLPSSAMDATGNSPNVEPAATQREIEMDAQLDGVLKFDHEIAAQADMTPEAIKAASTAELLKHFLFSKMAVWLKLYDDPKMGVRRSLRGSRTLAECFRRPDTMQAFVDWNQDLIAILNKMSPDNAIGKGISSRIMAGDDLLQAPEVAQKWKGFEKPLLRVMCERYRAMNEANDRFSEAAKPFGASFRAMGPIIKKLAADLDPAGKWETGSASGGVSDLVNRVERLVK